MEGKKIFTLLYTYINSFTTVLYNMTTISEKIVLSLCCEPISFIISATSWKEKQVLIFT